MLGRGLPAAATRLVRPGLKSGDQKKINDLYRAIREADAEGSAGKLLGQKLGMVHRKGSPIRQVNVKRVKRPSRMNLAQLLVGHVNILATIIDAGQASGFDAKCPLINPSSI